MSVSQVSKCVCAACVCVCMGMRIPSVNCQCTECSVCVEMYIHLSGCISHYYSYLTSAACMSSCLSVRGDASQSVSHSISTCLTFSIPRATGLARILPDAARRSEKLNHPRQVILLRGLTRTKAQIPPAPAPAQPTRPEGEAKGCLGPKPRTGPEGLRDRSPCCQGQMEACRRRP